MTEIELEEWAVKNGWKVTRVGPNTYRWDHPGVAEGFAPLSFDCEVEDRSSIRLAGYALEAVRTHWERTVSRN